VPLTATIKSGGVSSIFDPYAICRLVTGLRAPVRGLPKELHPGRAGQMLGMAASFRIPRVHIKLFATRVSAVFVRSCFPIFPNL
jgi:hypothetical protein